MVADPEITHKTRFAAVRSEGDHHRVSITTSITFYPDVWDRIRSFLVIDVYDKDGGHKDPRIRIGFDDLPEQLGRELAFFEMPCVACGRPIKPLRRREGDDFTRLFYAPTCEIRVRIACSRTRAAELEYERFKGLEFPAQPSRQLQLF